ncbi:DUF3618 domain-containing protein [Sphingobium bisphenolivorans]|uniref:DUF3618 domain-containing protein n=1 Tax=Sphingobium bisphenolivorans TaxID=1335760 RepID=UPI00039E9E42|nr:DUF3618 domain-containing protein [Sphingobium bisphenolivorans]
MTDTVERDPDAIERDIRRTQEDMSRTIDRIGDQLTPRNLFNALLDKADDNNVDARMLLDGARRNPLALGLIAAGTIWLISDNDAKLPSFRSKGGGKSDGHVDPHHRDYVEHMSAVEMRDGEDVVAYQRRRDAARANYLMVERRHDEDDNGFRQRLDDVTDKFREKRHAWAQTSGQAYDAAGRTVSQASHAAGRAAAQASDRAKSLYDSNPFVGGLIAAAVGAALGSVVPLSRTEQEKLGPLGEKARAAASEQKDALTDKLREAKDGLVDKADSSLQQGGETSSSGQQPQPFQSTTPAYQDGPPQA